MTGDVCETRQVLLQENGIIRNLDGKIIGRMSTLAVPPNHKVWECKIVTPATKLQTPMGFMGHPQTLVCGAFRNAGIHITACFSRWYGSLTSGELHKVSAFPGEKYIAPGNVQEVQPCD